MPQYETRNLKGWISGIRMSGDLTVNTYRDEEHVPPMNTLVATANGNTSTISWYDGATPDVRDFMDNFAPLYYPDVEYHPGDVVANKDTLDVYICQEDTSGEFDPDKWQEVNMVELIKTIAPKEVFVGDEEPVDGEIVWIDEDEDYPMPEGFISYAEVQTLTPEQQQRARNNIGAGKAEVIIDGHTTPTEGELLWVDQTEDYDPVEGVIHFDVAQTLTPEQKKRARENIGAGDDMKAEVIVNGSETPTGGELLWVDQTEDYDVAEGSVRYDVEQMLTAEQKIRARHNIGEEVHIGTAPSNEDLWVDPTEDYSTIEGSVSYSLAQALTTEQQKRARMNIGIDLQSILNDIAAIKAQLGM